MPCFCNSIYISNHPYSDWSWKRIAFRVNILSLKGKLLAVCKESYRPSSKQSEILQSSSKEPGDADMQTKSSEGRLSQVSSTKSKPFQVPSQRGHLQRSGSSPALNFMVSHRCAALLPPQSQIPPSRTVSSACLHFQINLDIGLARSLGTEIQLNPTFQNDLCMHLCVTASPVLQITPEIEKDHEWYSWQR